ncbi:thioredoxin reductase [Evansella vedderi]|uniref:Thioredoxin reductase n=1 Tax=Evansella vedderi TaxID=38282 RepID=A0ABU0A1F3_9BACI|nr:thioredoxin reductase [Evansella vedderi]
MFDWVIIGGGVHGCTVASYLIKSGKTTADKLRVIDPHHEPMFRWKRNTSLIGMEFLRSPSVHHLDMDPLSLHKYAKKMQEDRAFYGEYDRPSLDLFNNHCNDLLQQLNIFDSWHTGKVTKVEKNKGVWNVYTDASEIILGKNLVITISINDQLNIPEWAVAAKGQTSIPMYHIFEEGLPNLKELKTPVIVVGGGITAAHLTINLSSIYPGDVILLKRHPFRVYPFDSDPGWLGPKNLSSFHKINDYEKRRNLIQQARHKGSIPRELNNSLKRLQRRQQIHIVDGEVVSVGEDTDTFTVQLENKSKLKGGALLLATGFNPSRPGKGWLKELIHKHQLKCAKCGYPIVNESLEWCEHLYVSGALAELEIGPVSRNISGARKAAERIISSIG